MGGRDDPPPSPDRPGPGLEGVLPAPLPLLAYPHLLDSRRLVLQHVPQAVLVLGGEAHQRQRGAPVGVGMEGVGPRLY